MEKLNPFPMRAYRNTSVAEVDDVVWCAHGATHRQEDAFLEEDYVYLLANARASWLTAS